ncbi:MAG: winged helix-turn-helix domain-containing protein [bacterium]
MYRRIRRVLEGLSSGERVRIYTALLQHELCICEIVELFELSRSDVLDHLDELENSGLIRSDERGDWTYYQAHGHPIQEACDIVRNENETSNTWHEVRDKIKTLRNQRQIQCNSTNDPEWSDLATTV